MSSTRIGIFGHYGNENLGDEAIILACVQQLGRRLPSAELVLLSLKPSDSSSRYDLPALPIRRGSETSRTATEQRRSETSQRIDYSGASSTGCEVKESLLKRTAKSLPLLAPVLRTLKGVPQRLKSAAEEVRFLAASRGRLKELDYLIVAGSNQFLDNFGGPWGFPYTLLKWALLARSVGVPVAYVSVGAGPLDSRLSHFMIRRALRSAAYLSFRDNKSRELVDPRDAFGGKVYPDLAFFVELPSEGPAGAKSHEHGAVVAINPMPVYDARYWYIQDSEKYQAYVEKIVQLVEYIARVGYVPRLFPTQTKDRNVIDDIVNALVDGGRDESWVRDMAVEPSTVDELLRFLLAADIVVPTRFHGTVLGLWAGKPTIGACYYRKAKDLLVSFGQSDLAFDIDDLEVEELCRAVNETAARADAVSRDIRRRRDEYVRALHGQFDELAELIASQSGVKA